jgi:hypothetical protein
LKVIEDNERTGNTTGLRGVSRVTVAFEEMLTTLSNLAQSIMHLPLTVRLQTGSNLFPTIE